MQQVVDGCSGHETSSAHRPVLFKEHPHYQVFVSLSQFVGSAGVNGSVLWPVKPVCWFMASQEQVTHWFCLSSCLSLDYSFIMELDAFPIVISHWLWMLMAAHVMHSSKATTRRHATAPFMLPSRS